MRRRVNYIFILFPFIFSALFSPVCGTVIGDGIITGDTLWTSTDIIEIVDSVVITATGHLTIEPGTIIRVALMGKINIYGQLTAVGDETNRIVFTTVADTINGSPGPSNFWYGLAAWEGGRLVMNYCDIRYALMAAYISGADGEFSNCTAENFIGHGFFIDGKDGENKINIDINSCRIIQTNPGMIKQGIGIYAIRNVDLSVAHTEISDCRLGISLESYNTSSPIFSIKRTEISRHSEDGISMYGGG